MTEILFWDGPENGIATYKYEVEKEFENCVCCFTNPIPAVSQTITVYLFNTVESLEFSVAQVSWFPEEPYPTNLLTET